MKTRSRGPGYYFPLFLIFFAVPYLFDLAFCEELYATQASRAALVDGEKVDPYEGGGSSWTSLDCAPRGDLGASPTPPCFAPHSSEQACSFRAPIPGLLTSRPPPAS